MTLRPYLIFSRPVIVHVSSHPSRPYQPYIFFTPSPLSANLFADILDINTSREPRVTSLALVVVRLQSRSIPLFLARDQHTSNYVCILPALRDNLLEHRIYNVSS
jgi:hypothetical protein